MLSPAGWLTRADINSEVNAFPAFCPSCDSAWKSCPAVGLDESISNPFDFSKRGLRAVSYTHLTLPTKA